MSINRTIITTVVALALVAVVAPVAASATTVADLMAQITALQAQLSGLSGTPASGTGLCAGVTFTRNLTVGSTGSDVKCLQQILLVTPTSGYFGPKTLAAVKAYQTTQGLTPANQVGPMTRAKLNASLGSTTPVVPGQPAQTGAVSAMLASSTPPAGAIIGGQATASMLDVNFTGTGTVTSVTLQRSGISDQNLFSNVYLYDGATRLTDGYSFNINGQLVMNGLSIAVNGSKVISVKGDVSCYPVGGPTGTCTTSSVEGTATVTVTGYTANGSAVSANVMGNMMSIISGSAASATVGGQTVISGAYINAGTMQYTFWSAPVQVNTRAILLKTANFKMVGSAPSDALSNIKMFIDGVDTGKVASVASVNGSNYAMFDLTSAPITLTTGSHTIDVRADVQKGTNRNVAVSIQQAADLTLTDPQVGINIAAAGIPTGAATINISTGSVTTVVNSAFTSQTDVSSGATNAVIGKFTVHAYGEDVKVMDLYVTPAFTGSPATAPAADGLNNVTLYFNGSQIGSQKNWASGTLDFTLGSQMILTAGQDSTIEVRADLQTAGNLPYTAGTVTTTLVGKTSNAQGQSSQQTLGVPQTTSVATNGLSIASGNLQVAANTAFLGQNINPNSSNVKIGSYIIQNQSTSESIRLTSLNVVTTNSGTLGINDLSALKTSDTTGSGSTPIQPNGNDTFSINDTLAPGATMIVDIFANTGSDTTGTVLTKLTVASIGVTDNIPAPGSQITGQSMVLNQGTVATPTVVSSSTTARQFIAAAGGAANATQMTLNFVSSNGAATITELKFGVTGTNTVTNICVGSVCAQPVGTTADLTGLSLAVANGGGGLTQNVQVSYSSVGTGGITPNTPSTVSLTYVKYTSGGKTAAISPTVVAPTVYLVGSKPTVVINQSGSASGLIISGATNKIGEVTVTADLKGNIKINQIAFSVGTSGFTTSTIASPFLVAGTSGNTAISTISCSGTTTITCVSSPSTYADDYAITAGSSQIFSLYATVTGTAQTSTNAGISTSLVSGSFLWDDTSTNGASGTGLTGGNVYAFPTNSYSVHQ